MQARFNIEVYQAKFIQDLYRFYTEENLELETRYNDQKTFVTQLVSPAISNEEDANKLCNSLKNVIATSTLPDIQVQSSRRVIGAYRVVIFNPRAIIFDYMKQFVELLNQKHPLPSHLDQIGYRWEAYHSMHLMPNIGYGIYDCDLSQNNNQFILKDFNKKIKNMFGHLKLYRGIHKGYTQYSFDIEKFNFEDFQILSSASSVPSLKQLCINFFHKNPPTKEELSLLPKEVSCRLFSKN